MLILSFLAGAAIVLLGWTWFFNTIFAIYYACKGARYVYKNTEWKELRFSDFKNAIMHGLKGAIGLK